MNEIMKIDSVQTYNDYFGVEMRHPLVSGRTRGKTLAFRA